MYRVLKWVLLGAIVSAAWGQQYAFLPVPGSPKSVKILFQDSRGRLWLGGDDVTCFDGTRFFSLRDYGLPATAALSIAEDPGGALWIGTMSGVYRFAKGRVEVISPGVAVSVIAPTADLAVAAVGPPGLGLGGDTLLVRMQRTGGAWKTETIMDLESPGPLTLDQGGWLLYPWPAKGWVEIRLEDVARWRAGTQLPVAQHRVANSAGNGGMKVMRDHAGCLWSGAVGANSYDCGDGSHLAPSPGARPDSNMHEAADGTMVLWGGSLLAVGRPGSFRVATQANGLPGLADAMMAADGTVWLGTTQGLYRMAGGFRIEYWTVHEGLRDAPWSVARSGGKVYAGLDRRIVVLSPDRTRWDSVATFEEGLVAALLGDSDGTLWAAFQDGGVAQLDAAGRVIARTAQNRLAHSMRMARSEEGEVWLGGTSLSRLTRTGNLLQYEDHALETRPSKNVLAIKYEEHTRKLWGCYNGGIVARDEHGAWKEFTTRDGLLINGCWSLAPLPNGDVWYAYFNLPAIARIRPAPGGGITVRQFQAKDGISEPAADTMDSDREGRLWRGGDTGIYVADPAGAEAGNWLRLDQSDGLPANGMNSGSVYADPDGSLWWGADNDLAHYTPPADLVAPRVSPQVFVSAFSWGGGAPRLADAVHGLPHGANIVAHIGSLQFERRNALRLRYRILPEQTSWRESRGLDLALGSLSSGVHTLEVQARIFTGPWSPTVSRGFTVPLPAWLTWPFTLTYLMTAMSLSAGAYLLRRRRRTEESEMLPDLAAWRLGALLPEVYDMSGTVLDSRFEVGALLARGGFANVMTGYDRSRKERCAIKIFRHEVKVQSWILQRFEQEVAALQKVRHPNVVSIYAHGIAPSGSPYLVMEFVEGGNLRELLERSPLARERTARFLGQLAAALDAIHAQNICHRDVKPENVMIRDQGSPQEAAILIDFSIAIVKDANETLHGLSRAAGSFDYMAPEQAIGYAEPSSDIYSLAKLVIEMLTGRQLKHLLPDAALDLPGRVRELARSLPVALSEDSAGMLAAALEFDPTRRPSVAGLFAGPIIADLESQPRTRSR
jgi:tRNA A-37 threonylcarbamoyl transferase component Bud32/sugar lactone lactonase YvrE